MSEPKFTINSPLECFEHQSEMWLLAGELEWDKLVGTLRWATLAGVASSPHLGSVYEQKWNVGRRGSFVVAKYVTEALCQQLFFCADPNLSPHNENNQRCYE